MNQIENPLPSTNQEIVAYLRAEGFVAEISHDGEVRVDRSGFTVGPFPTMDAARDFVRRDQEMARAFAESQRRRKPDPNAALAKVLKARLKRHLARCVIVANDGRAVVSQDESWAKACEVCRIGEDFAKAMNLGPDFLELCGVPAARALLKERR